MTETQRMLVTRFVILLCVLISMLITPSLPAQDIRLTGLFKRRAPVPQMVVGYRVDADWPAVRDATLDEGAVSASAVDGQGQVWVLRRGAVPVQVYDREGKLVRSWGEGQFRKPHGLAIGPEDGTIWITDAGLHTVTQFTPEGQALRMLGTPGELGEDATHFNQPTDVAIGRDGVIYVSDGYGNNRVVRFDALGNVLGVIGGVEGSGPGQFRLPHALAVDGAGRLYVADRSNARVQVFDAEGKYLAEWRNLLVPWDLAMSPDGRSILVCGSSPMRRPAGAQVGVPLGIPPRDQLVMKLDLTGRLLELWTFPLGGDAAGELEWVHGLGVDEAGDLYLGDIEGRRIQKFERLEADDAASKP